ncbi:DNA-3-methyladenine glycosylase I [Streptococcus fryi]
MKICSWVKADDDLEVAYHNQEWGKPLHDEQQLFELLCLESYQAGLSWSTILHKREAFRQAFYDYDIARVAQMTDEDLDALLQNDTIIRHKAKLYATRQNARAFQAVQEAFGSFNDYIWGFVDGKPLVNQVVSYKEAPTKTVLSELISKDLKKRGFTFVGPVMVYSFLQAAGLVDDHENGCLFKSIN